MGSKSTGGFYRCEWSPCALQSSSALIFAPSSQVLDDPGELLLGGRPDDRVRVLQAARVHAVQVLGAARPQVQQQRRGHGRLWRREEIEVLVDRW